MQQGTVKWFSDTKGYGFITPNDGSSDVFVHYTAIEGHGRRTLETGQDVEYEAEKTPKGMQAKTVRTSAVVRKG